MSSFPQNAPSANPVFYRTYSRRLEQGKEHWDDVVSRCVWGLSQVGNFTKEEESLVRDQMSSLHSLPSGRWLWVGGTDWIQQPKNFSGAYNCTSTDLLDLEAFPLQMALLMMGSGTGAIIEPQHIDKLPEVCNKFNLEVLENIGTHQGARSDDTRLHISEEGCAEIRVGDSREGWVHAFLLLLQIATDKHFMATDVVMDLSRMSALPTHQSKVLVVLLIRSSLPLFTVAQERFSKKHTVVNLPLLNAVYC